MRGKKKKKKKISFFILQVSVSSHSPLFFPLKTKIKSTIGLKNRTKLTVSTVSSVEGYTQKNVLSTRVTIRINLTVLSIDTKEISFYTKEVVGELVSKNVWLRCE